MNTVDNWFKRMEKEKIHFLHRDNYQRRIYDDTDLIIAILTFLIVGGRKNPAKKVSILANRKDLISELGDY